jgi:hypothetical protein
MGFEKVTYYYNRFYLYIIKRERERELIFIYLVKRDVRNLIKILNICYIVV